MQLAVDQDTDGSADGQTHAHYEVVGVSLVCDSFWKFGEAETWFDDVQVQDHTLREPVGSELWCPVRPDGQVSACLT